MKNEFTDARLRERINGTTAVIRALKKLSPVMSIGEMEMLLTVANREGFSQVEYAYMTGVKLTTAARYLMNLSDKLRTGEKGLQLLNREQVATDLRMNSYTLTKKGRDLVKLLLVKRDV